ncbi:MAG: peptide chain release factor N(5)-glutamine methyltransferase [Chitinivibrionales bacterium]|nr:peptide chain release factor N(5)-glutamine methyltransferase [Chitinivibrionales bacterium]
MKSRTILRQCAGQLGPVAGALAQKEAELILCTILNCTRNELLLNNLEIESGMCLQIDAYCQERLSGKPLAHVLGKAYFYNREFKVSADTLIPRPDTETVVEVVLKYENPAPRQFLDLCTGSGILACILGEVRPRWQATATDISYPALQIAQDNALAMLPLCCMNELTAFKSRKTFDFIVSNPPYIAGPVLRLLDQSVTAFEPHAALYGGEDGLDFYRMMAQKAPMLLKTGGRLYCEIGYDQKEAVSALFSPPLWKPADCFCDLARRDRVLRVECVN